MRHGDLFPGDLGSDTFRIEVNAEPTSVTAIPSLSTADYAAIAAEYKKFKEPCWIDPLRFMGVHYAHFEAAGPVTVTISCPSPVKSCVVHPLRRGVKPAIEGDRVTMTLGQSQPRFFIVDIDDHPLLVIIVESPETSMPNRGASNVLDLGEFVTGSGSVEERTAGFQLAFAHASKTKKTLYVPAGVYHVNTLKLHGIDGLSVYFAPGSLLRTEVSPAGQNIHSHGLWFEDSKNIHIFGRGCLDHQGFGNFAHGRNAYDHGLISYFVTSALCPWMTESPVFMLRCANITMDGFMVRNGRNMNFNIRRSDDITLRNCKIVTPPASCPEYTDGYHTNSCRNVLIENCLAFCNDDCYASGHYMHVDDRDSGPHTIRGLVGWNVRANGIRLGFHTYYNLGDFRFENCDFSGFIWRGLMAHPLHDAQEAGRFQRYGTISLTDCGFDCARLKGPLVEIDNSRADAFEMTDCTADGTAAIQVKGHDESGLVNLVKIRNVRIAGKRIESPSDPILEAHLVGKIQIS